MPILSGIVSKVRVDTESTVGAFVGRAIFLQGVVPPDLMTGLSAPTKANLQMGYSCSRPVASSLNMAKCSFHYATLN